MKKAFCAALFCLVVSSSAFATLVTFDEVSLGTTVPPSFAINGITFTASGSGPQNNGIIGNSSTVPVGSSTLLTGQFLAYGGLGSNSPQLAIAFGPGALASSISFILNDTEWTTAGVNLEIFDSSVTSLGNFVIQQGEDLDIGFEGVVNLTSFVSGSTLISSIQLTDIGPDGFAIDDVQADLPEAPVPEPATFALLGGALAGLGLLKFGKRS